MGEENCVSVTDFTGLRAETRGCVATIGFFDGVHLGHRYLLRRVVELARQKGFAAMAVTFACHPREVLDTDYRPQILTTTTEKLRLLAACGVDACAVLHFDKAMSAMSSREFMEKILLRCLGVRCLLIGYDHRFGHDRNAGFADYCREGREMGIEVLPAEAYKPGGLAVSSSLVRRLLNGGLVERAAQCLGRPYSLEGKVVNGKKLGRTIGFPTANLLPYDCRKLIPARGVYAVKAMTEGGKTYPAMLNIGLRPTIDDHRGVTIETHIFDYSGDLYGTTLRLEFMERLRDEMKFPSLERLRGQLAEDARKARAVLDNENATVLK